ncbi:LysR substrate-binding domain-containing protein [Variovorax sp. ZT5P49]|uniref:LysR substrate-binding domain-containing protein n=1 Tax=Variovorax sp. ZT5P49 TaxID=3443733 RepID=UPI003F44E278
MKLSQLESLVAVVEHGGIRAAARELNVSQAAVTKSMRLLEEDAGIPLLVRQSRGIALTAAGTRLLERARVITRQTALAREELRQGNGEDFGTVQIGVTPFLTFTGLGEAFNWFRHRYQNVQLNVIEGLMSRVLPRLRNGTLDMAAVAADVGEVQGDEFRVQRIFQARQCIVVREGHPMQKKPTARGLASCEWVLTQPIGGGQQPRIEAMFSLAGVPPPSRVVVCEALSAMALVRSTDVVSIVPEPLLGHFESSGIVPISEAVFHPCDVELLILTRADVPLTPAAEYFAHCLSKVSQPG